MTRPLSADERAILEALLAEPFPGRDELRAQLPFTQAVQESDPDFIHFDVDRSAVPPAPVTERVPTGGHGYNRDGFLVGIMLFVGDGYLEMLEYWNTTEPPASGPVRPETIQLDQRSAPKARGTRVLLNELPDREPGRDNH
jgi:hypothetical protein